jgi:hypothetical protein
VRRSQRNLIWAVGLVVVALIVGRYFVQHPSTTTTITTTASSTSTTSTTTTQPSSTTTVASLTTCRGSQFTGVNVGSEGAAGTGYDIMTLTKVSGNSCVVDGYPIVTLLNSTGAIKRFTLNDSTNFPTVPANAAPVAHNVVVGQKIDIQLRYSDIGAGTEACASVSKVSVQFVAGDTAVPVNFAYPISPCGNVVDVSGFYPA